MRKRTTSRRKTTGAKHHTRRRHTTRTHTVKRRRTTRRKGMLSEFFNPGQAAEAAKVVLEGAAGGVGAHFLNKVLPSSINPAQKAIITVGAGFVSAAMLKRPILGAGMAAIGVMNLLTETKLLADDTEGDFASGMDSLPMVLNENAYPLSDGMYLADNMYLNDGMYLSDDYDSAGTDYEVGYYPEFGGI